MDLLVTLLCLYSLGYFVGFSANTIPDGFTFTDETLPLAEYGKQTYYNVVDMSKTRPDFTVTYRRLLVAANGGFNFIKDKTGITTEGSQIALVACLGVEGQTMIYCTSTPRADINKFFKKLLENDQDPQTETPRWEKAYRVDGHGTWAHAEDFAYWIFEPRQSMNGAPADMYPPGTTIAVWSSISAGDRGTGKAYWPCTATEANRVPPCQDVAGRLGVVHAVSDAYANIVNPQGAPPPDPLAPDPLEERSLYSRFYNSTLFKRVDAPQLDLTPATLPDEIVEAMDNADRNPPAYDDLPPPDAIQPEDQYDSQELDEQGAPDADDTQDTGDTSDTDTATDTGTATGTGTVTDGPTGTPSCYLQNQDPDRGITDRYCICDESMTYPTQSLDPTAANDELCAYTTLPDATTTYASGFGAPSTYTNLCQVCTQDVVNEAECTSIPNCVSQQAAASVTAATQGMHVGTLTGDALYTSVSNALESICPDVTQTTSATECSGTATIPDITYVDNESRGNDGELKVSVAFSSYNVTSLKHAMIKSLAASARDSATGGNCYDARYEYLDKRTYWPPSFSLFARDRMTTQWDDINLCNTAELALVNYYSPLWRLAPDPGATDYIEVKYEFHETGGSFECEFIELLVDSLAVIAPEFAIADVELGEAIHAACEALEE